MNYFFLYGRKKKTRSQVNQWMTWYSNISQWINQWGNKNKYVNGSRVIFSLNEREEAMNESMHESECKNEETWKYKWERQTKELMGQKGMSEGHNEWRKKSSREDFKINELSAVRLFKRPVKDSAVV